MEEKEERIEMYEDEDEGKDDRRAFRELEEGKIVSYKEVYLGPKTLVLTLLTLPCCCVGLFCLCRPRDVRTVTTRVDAEAYYSQAEFDSDSE